MIDEMDQISDKTQREELKNQMVLIREQGQYEDSIKGFNQVLEWDKLNNNPRGEIDVLGHLRIAYVDWAGDAPSEDLKVLRIQAAVEIQGQQLKLLEKSFMDDKGIRSMVYTHHADMLIEQMKMSKSEADIKSFAEKAMIAINYSMDNFAGSEGHKAHIFNKKAQVLYLSGNTEGSIEALIAGEIAIFNGYPEEMKQSDGIMKIRVWQTGLWLTRAYICIKEGRSELGIIYAQLIANIEDPSGTLGTRKKQAKRLLEFISKSNNKVE